MSAGIVGADMELYVLEDGKRLRCGYTTGTTAALAAQAAVRVLLQLEMSGGSLDHFAACKTGREGSKAGQESRAEGYYIPCAVMTPKGVLVEADALVCETGKDPDYAVCAVKKDGGDDQDVTNGLTIYARAEWIEKNNIVIECGEGIGTVTKPGLPVPVGEKALNPVPRRMIEDTVREILSGYRAATGEEYASSYFSGLKITLTIPEGEKAARSTFNERLGIVGGISIIGTSGIVEPMSKKAFADAVCLEIRQQAELGRKKLILTPGNYGEDFIRKLESVGINDDGEEDLGTVAITEAAREITGITAQPESESRNEKKQDPAGTTDQSIISESVLDLRDYSLVVCSNFIGEALDEAIADGFTDVLLIGHAGKLVKLAGGIMNTHSRMADCRMELICAHAAIQGAGAELCKRIMETSTTEAAFSLIREESEELLQRVLNSLLSAIQFHLKERIRKHEKGAESGLQIGAVMFFKNN
ncbi:MAG: cobalt-precorrin-5B (C(1))-methyltransferase [Lachnospiraceae bacterium]|nr:cobalt-precorrin-5B (C(1))-methyltransferase [Lachnospiraceae bacterium]